MFQFRGNHVLKGATIKGKNLLPVGSIFFPLKVAPTQIGNNFKGHLIEKLPKLNDTNKSHCLSLKTAKSAFENCLNFDATKINCFTFILLCVSILDITWTFITSARRGHLIHDSSRC